MIISHTIKFGSRKWRINVKKYVFLERPNRGQLIFIGVISIMPCATAVYDFLGVMCATIGVSCSTMRTQIFFVTLLSSICPMLRPLSCLTMLSGYNYSLICRFKLKFSQNYKNINKVEIQH